MNEPEILYQRNPENGKWSWWIIASNGKVLAKSEHEYSSLNTAMLAGRAQRLLQRR